MPPKPKSKVQRHIPGTNEIKSFVHCRQCMSNIPHGESPRSWAALEVGFTELGIQVWCKRCEINVFHMDLEGTKHPARTHRELDS